MKRLIMDSDALYVKLLDGIAVGIFTVNLNWEITFFNREAEKITGFTKKDAVGSKCYEIFRTELCHKGCHLKRAIRSKTKIVKVRNIILTKGNRETPVDITVSILRNDKGRIIGGIESFLDDSVRVSLEKEVYKSYVFDDVIGRDEKILGLFDIFSCMARTETQILIVGETGTGKGIFARAIHNMSPRSKKPFVKVNCAALPANLIESELFGYKKGAFTDAKNDKPGRFQSAEGGTILLDEIGDIPIDLQAKLLEVLDEKMFYPLGSAKPVKVDVRIIATTNKDLQHMMKNGLFRGDLYYRLNAVEIKIPPLRERVVDIPLLADHFLRQYSNGLDKNIQRVNPEAMKILLGYYYPGNVRELKHIIEHAVIVCNGDEVGTDDLPLSLRKQISHTMAGGVKQADDLERSEILDALRSHGWNRGKAAKALKINRTTLWRRMRKFGLQHKSVA
ncbi:MAG TPA: sigma 54-interacting transcriptional regulator [Syntrophorhabdaceae bacterium]|nr:sigma 54-interacting transcriptional regulator [Syntrophorhabdaceae bacterium]HQM81113.1 sigma 54-interacting transcriptional regulator [Syntrophorhabdaceae bacterium]